MSKCNNEGVISSWFVSYELRLLFNSFAVYTTITYFPVEISRGMKPWWKLFLPSDSSTAEEFIANCGMLKFYNLFMERCYSYTTTKSKSEMSPSYRWLQSLMNKENFWAKI